MDPLSAGGLRGDPHYGYVLPPRRPADSRSLPIREEPVLFIRIVPILAALLVTPALAAPSFLVDSEWLAEHRDDPRLRILEVRYHPHRYFTVGHIPGAVQV
jgi:hypothetical protein